MSTFKQIKKLYMSLRYVQHIYIKQCFLHPQIPQKNFKKTDINYKEALYQYQSKTKVYQQTYIQPLTYINYNIINVVRDQQNEKIIKAKIQQQVKNFGLKEQRQQQGEIIDKKSKIKVKNRLQIWKQLPESQKNRINQKVKQIKQNTKQLLIDYRKAYKIPPGYKSTSHSVTTVFMQNYAAKYYQNSNDKKFTKGLLLKLKQLSYEQQILFKQRADELNANIIKEYDSFLARWDLSSQQLTHIIQVSRNYKKALKEEYGWRNKGKKIIQQ